MNKRLAERVSDFLTAVSRPAIPRAGAKGGRLGYLATTPLSFGLSTKILDIAPCHEVDNQRLKQDMLADGITLYHHADIKVAT